MTKKKTFAPLHLRGKNPRTKTNKKTLINQFPAFYLKYVILKFEVQKRNNYEISSNKQRSFCKKPQKVHG